MSGFVTWSAERNADLDKKLAESGMKETLTAKGVSEVNQRHMLACVEQNVGHMQRLAHNPALFNEAFPNMAHSVNLTEDTLAANIPTWTQTSMGLISPLFEHFFLGEVIDLGTMSQPTTYLQREYFKAGTEVEGSEYWDADADEALAMDLDLDVDYLAFNSECGNPNEIDYELTQELVTAVRKGVSGDVGSLVQHDAQTQFGVNVLDRVMGFAATELQRELQGEALAAAVAGVSETVTWTADPPAGSAYESLDPVVWDRTLMNVAMNSVDVAMMGENSIRAGFNVAVARPSVLGRLTKLNQHAFELNSKVTDTMGQDFVYHNLFGVSKAGNRKFFQYEYLADNTILCVHKGPRRVMAHLTYVPIESFGVFREPRNGCSRFGMHTRYANKILLSAGLKKITITPEAEASA